MYTLEIIELFYQKLYLIHIYIFHYSHVSSFLTTQEFEAVFFFIVNGLQLFSTVDFHSKCFL